MSGCSYIQDHYTNYLPQVGLDVHATVLSASSRTIITQTYENPSTTKAIPEVFYSFPLYEVSVVAAFVCKIGDKTVKGVVKPRKQADVEYKKAKAAGKTAAIFDQNQDAADVFSTRVGNLPAGEKVLIEITLVAELKQDAQTNGPRYTLPMIIAQRYGSQSAYSLDAYPLSQQYQNGASILVDVMMERDSNIISIQSPGHPINVQLGRTSIMPASTHEPCYASVKLRTNSTMEADFVLSINATKQDLPCAFLEKHPTLPNQRALMVSLVPKFQIPSDPSEIIFVIDRSGSMESKIPTLRSALEVFLKSLPSGTHFNILSFGTQFSSLWQQSKPCNRGNLKQALELMRCIHADHGGTDILLALHSAIRMSYKDKYPDILLLTDGEIWEQEACIKFVNETKKTRSARFFTLGIGDSVSHALIEGVSRAGGGFSQTILNLEELDKKVIRMLKGALMGRLSNITLDFDSQDNTIEEEFMEVEVPKSVDGDSVTEKGEKPIPLFDENYEEPESIPEVQHKLPELSIPKIMHVPTELPPLFPFIRSTVYVLFSEELVSVPQKIFLRANSNIGPLELEIPIQDVGEGQTIHQLAAKKAMSELEEGRGWIHSAKDPAKELITVKYESMVDDLVQSECERLGARFQVSGKHCSFLAIHDNQDEDVKSEEYFFMFIDDETLPTVTPHSLPSSHSYGSRYMGGRLDSSAVVRQSAAGIYIPPATRQNVGPQAFCGSRGGGSRGGRDGLSQPRTRQAGRRNIYAAAPAIDYSHQQTSQSTSEMDKFHRLVSMQELEGYWKWSDGLLQIIGLSEEYVKIELELRIKEYLDDNLELASTTGSRKNILKKAKCRDYLATALVLHYFETYLDDSKEVWEMLKAKAEEWSEVTLRAMNDEDGYILENVLEAFIISQHL